MHDDPHIPDDLAQALKGAFPRVQVPEHVDRTVLSGARRHLLRRRWKPLVGIAAAIAIVGGVAFVALQPEEAPRQVALDMAPAQRVTILDALSAARQGDALAADELSRRAVSLEGLP